MTTDHDKIASELAALRERFEYMRNEYSSFAARPCALCVYEAGRFIRRCKLHEEIDRLNTELAKLHEVARGNIQRDPQIHKMVALAPIHVDLTDPDEPYPAELVGDYARAVIALDKEIDDMGRYNIECHAEYKKRRNEQHDAYDKLHAETQQLRTDLAAATEANAQLRSALAARDQVQAAIPGLQMSYAGSISFRPTDDGKQVATMIEPDGTKTTKDVP